MSTDSSTASFAEQHADSTRGWRAVPRWFRETPFWQAREGQHRAVIDQLYQMMASQRVVQHGTGVVCERGQWAISIESLAAASGVTPKVTRRAVEHAVSAGIVGQAVRTIRLPRRTLHISLFTWRDFELYDQCSDATDKPLGIPLGKPVGRSLGKPLGTPVGKVIHQSTTPASETSDQTQAEESAASPLGASGPSEADAPHALSASSGDGREAEQVTAQRASPASPAKSPKGKQPKVKTARRQPTTDEDKAQITSSAINYLGYLAHGRDALGLQPEAWAGLAPSRDNWAPLGRNYGSPEAGVPATALGAYAAYSLNWAREQAGLPLVMFDLGWLNREVEKLSATHTHAEIALHIARVAANWPAIVKATAWMTQPLELRGGTLTHKKVLELSADIAAGKDITATATRSTDANPFPRNDDLAAQLKARANRTYAI